ncbi:MAG TPA: three-Cys-motif partner protein TcmP [Pseudolabrys sp.]|nr:three-Cys-motif partner protein TcmP [Pseudolabrys sp.]
MATLIASDGLPARESGEWAKDKLFYVARYMDIFASSMKNKWSHRAYIDLMSGPGLCVVPGNRQEFDGSPLLALKSPTPFTDVILVEADTVLVDALVKRTSAPGLRPRPSIIPGDCNDQTVIDEIRGRVDQGTVSLVFVDLLGMDVAMATLAKLTSKLPMDLIITFPELDVVPNREAALADNPQHAGRFDRFFGQEWRAAARKQKVGRRESDSLISFYAGQLESLDYHTSVLPLTMKNRKRGTLYRPIFASRHTRGVQFWKEISEKRDASGQQRLGY